MNIFRSKERKKKHEKKVQDEKSLVLDTPRPPALPNQDQDPVYTPRSLQQPTQDYYPVRNSHSHDYRPPRNSHSRPSENNGPPVFSTNPRLRAQPRPPAQTQAHMNMPQLSPAYQSEDRVESLKQAPSRNHAHGADPSQDFYGSSSSQARTLKKAPPPAQAKASIESSGVDPADQMDHNAVTRELVKQFITDIWNRGDLDVIPKICARGIRFNGTSGMDRVGHEGFKKIVTTIRSSLDDYHVEICSMVVEGNKAFCSMRFMGRHVGRLLGCEPTGRLVSWMGAMEFTVMDGLIIKVWELGDMASLQQQLKEDSDSARESVIADRYSARELRAPLEQQLQADRDSVRDSFVF